MKPLPKPLLQRVARSKLELDAEISGNLYGKFFAALGVRLLDGKTLTSDAKAQVILALCAYSLHTKRRKHPQSSKRLASISGVSRATWNRCVKELAESGVVEREKEKRHKIRLPSPYFEFLGNKDSKDRFAQFGKRLARRLISRKWIATHPAGSRILLLFLAVAAADTRRAGVLYWIRSSRSDIIVMAPMGTTSVSSGLESLLKTPTPLLYRHPLQRCLYLVNPVFFHRGGSPDSLERELKSVPPESRIIDLLR